MNVNCNLTTCSFILNSKCVFYEGAALPYTGINTNDSVQVALQKIEEALSNTGTGVVIDITAGTGISIGGTPQHPIVTNTAPDQTVTFTNGVGISVTGTYPNFTISSTVETVTADNGLTKTVNNIQLGGPLIEESTNISLPYNFADERELLITVFDIATPVSKTDFRIGSNFGAVDASLIGYQDATQYSGLTVGANSKVSFFSINNIQGFDLSADAGVGTFIFTDNRTVKLGIQYAAAGYVTTDRTLIDRGFANLSYWPLTGTGTLTGNVTINASENDIDIQNVNTFTIQNSVGPIFTLSDTGITMSGVGAQTVGINSTGGASIASGTNSILVNSAGLTFRTSSTDRLIIEPDGSWNIGGSNGTAGFVLTSNGAASPPTWQAAGSGITNTAANNELMKSDGTNAVPSGIFSATVGTITIGDGSSGSIRTITSEGSSADVDMQISSKGSLGVASLKASGGSGFYAGNSLLQIIHNTVLEVDNGIGSSRIVSNPVSTTGVVSPLTLRRTSQGTPTTGIGTGLEFETETAVANNEIGVILESVSTDVTGGSEDFDFVIRTMSGGLTPTEKVRITSDGKLGVGSTAPTYDLDVNKSTAVTGRLQTTGTGSVELFLSRTAGTSSNYSLLLPTGDTRLQFYASGSEKFAMTNDGRFYGTALHNNAGAVTGTTNQYVASGTYTPTSTDVTNVDSSTPSVFQYIRVGNVVVLSGVVSIDLSAGGAFEIGLSFPIPSAITSQSQCSGTWSSGNANGYVNGDSTNDRIRIAGTGVSTSSVDYMIHCVYVIV